MRIIHHILEKEKTSKNKTGNKLQWLSPLILKAVKDIFAQTQELHFGKALASFRETLDILLFVTGSNSALLSGGLAALLAGRTVEFEIFPFSLYEREDYGCLSQICDVT